MNNRGKSVAFLAALVLGGCSDSVDPVTGHGVFPYVNVSEFQALMMFGRSSEAQAAFGGKEVSILFSPSSFNRTENGDYNLIDGSTNLRCELSEAEFGPLAAMPNPIPLVQGTLGVITASGAEIKDCEVVDVNGGQWEADLDAGKKPDVKRLKSEFGKTL